MNDDKCQQCEDGNDSACQECASLSQLKVRIATDCKSRSNVQSGISLDKKQQTQQSGLELLLDYKYQIKSKLIDSID